MSRVGFDHPLFLLIIPLLWLVGFVVVMGVVYLAVRLGVKHGIRDASRHLPPTWRTGELPPEPPTGPR